MANQKIDIPARTFVDITAAASLVSSSSYKIQPQGASIWIDEQSAEPSDLTSSFYVDPHDVRDITQGAENFYVYSLENCKVIIGEAP